MSKPDILNVISVLLHELERIDSWYVDREDPEVIRIIPQTWFVDTGEDVYEVGSRQETLPDVFEDVHQVEGDLDPVHVQHRVWQQSIVVDKDGCISHEEFGTRIDTFIVDPWEPECVGHSDGPIDYTKEHEWASPHELFGGLVENPGVQGHGGGVIVQEICLLCGLYKTTNTWGRHEITGEEGFRTVTYRESDGAQLALEEK